MGSLFQPIPSFDYAFRDGFSYEKWLEDRSHAELVVKAVERGMVESQGQLDTLIGGLEQISHAQIAGFEGVCDRLEVVNDTLVWGFVEIRQGLAAVEIATNEVRNSVDALNATVLQLAGAMARGFRDLSQSLEKIESRLERIESAVSDVQRAWAEAHLGRAIKAIEVGLIEDAVRILKTILDGGASQDPYDLDPRIYHLLSRCYCGTVSLPDIKIINLDESLYLAKRSVALCRIANDFGDEFVSQCYLQSAWVNYCLGNLSEAEQDYRKAASISLSFESEYGIAKALLAKKEFEPAEPVISRLLLKYRNKFLVVAASDPDFIQHKNGISELKAEILSSLRESLVDSDRRVARAFEKLEKLIRRTEGNPELAELSAWLDQLSSAQSALLATGWLHQLSVLDGDELEGILEPVIADIEAARSRLADVEIKLARALAIELGKIRSAKRKKVEASYAAQIASAQSALDNARQKWRYAPEAVRNVMLATKQEAYDQARAELDAKYADSVRGTYALEASKKAVVQECKNIIHNLRKEISRIMNPPHLKKALLEEAERQMPPLV